MKGRAQHHCLSTSLACTLLPAAVGPTSARSTWPMHSERRQPGPWDRVYRARRHRREDAVLLRLPGEPLLYGGYYEAGAMEATAVRVREGCCVRDVYRIEEEVEYGSVDVQRYKEKRAELRRKMKGIQFKHRIRKFATWNRASIRVGSKQAERTLFWDQLKEDRVFEPEMMKQIPDGFRVDQLLDAFVKDTVPPSRFMWLVQHIYINQIKSTGANKRRGSASSRICVQQQCEQAWLSCLVVFTDRLCATHNEQTEQWESLMLLWRHNLDMGLVNATQALDYITKQSKGAKGEAYMPLLVSYLDWCNYRQLHSLYTYASQSTQEQLMNMILGLLYPNKHGPMQSPQSLDRIFQQPGEPLPALTQRLVSYALFWASSEPLLVYIRVHQMVCFLEHYEDGALQDTVARVVALTECDDVLNQESYFFLCRSLVRHGFLYMEDVIRIWTTQGIIHNLQQKNESEWSPRIRWCHKMLLGIPLETGSGVIRIQRRILATYSSHFDREEKQLRYLFSMFVFGTREKASIATSLPVDVPPRCMDWDIPEWVTMFSNVALDRALKAVFEDILPDETDELINAIILLECLGMQDMVHELPLEECDLPLSLAHRLGIDIAVENIPSKHNRVEAEHWKSTFEHRIRFLDIVYALSRTQDPFKLVESVDEVHFPAMVWCLLFLGAVDLCQLVETSSATISRRILSILMGDPPPLFQCTHQKALFACGPASLSFLIQSNPKPALSLSSLVYLASGSESSSENALSILADQVQVEQSLDPKARMQDIANACAVHGVTVAIALLNEKTIKEMLSGHGDTCVHLLLDSTLPQTAKLKLIAACSFDPSVFRGWYQEAVHSRLRSHSNQKLDLIDLAFIVSFSTLKSNLSMQLLQAIPFLLQSIASKLTDSDPLNPRLAWKAVADETAELEELVVLIEDMPDNADCVQLLKAIFDLLAIPQSYPASVPDSMSCLFTVVQRLAMHEIRARGPQSTEDALRSSFSHLLQSVGFSSPFFKALMRTCPLFCAAKDIRLYQEGSKRSSASSEASSTPNGPRFGTILDSIDPWKTLEGLPGNTIVQRVLLNWDGFDEA